MYEHDCKEVQISVEFVRIGEIDVMNEKYFAEINLSIFWILDNQEKLYEDYDPNKHWNPNIYIENSFLKPEETITYKCIECNGSIGIIEKRQIQGFFWERMELHSFPFDLQELSITLATKLDPPTIKFKPKHLIINENAKFKFVEQQRWKLLELIESSDTTSYDIGSGNSLDAFDEETTEFQTCAKKPKLSIKGYAIRRPNYYLENAFFLILIITAMSLNVFSIDVKMTQSRLPTTGTILLTSVSFKWVINRSLPTVNYTTSLDRYSITSIVFLCSLCIWHAIVGSFWEKTLASQIDFWALMIFASIFVLIQLSFILGFVLSYLKIRKCKKRELEYIENRPKYKSGSSKYIF